jgi:hypothetical protein
LIQQLVARRTEKFAIVFKGDNSISAVFVLRIGSRLTNSFLIIKLLTMEYQREKCVGNKER